MSTSVQTRSETTGLNNVGTLAEALHNAGRDSSIWKISFSLENGERVRLIRKVNENFSSNWVLEQL